MNSPSGPFPRSYPSHLQKDPHRTVDEPSFSDLWPGSTEPARGSGWLIVVGRRAWHSSPERDNYG